MQRILACLRSLVRSSRPSFVFDSIGQPECVVVTKEQPNGVGSLGLPESLARCSHYYHIRKPAKCPAVVLRSGTPILHLSGQQV